MKIRLAWALGPVLAVVIGIFVSRARSAQEEEPLPHRGSVGPTPSMPASGGGGDSPPPLAAEPDPLDRRLPPPPYQKEESDWTRYREALTILRGTSDPDLSALAADRLRRLEDREAFRRYLGERRAEIRSEQERSRERNKALLELRQQEARQRLINAGFNPDGSPPPPLFERPKLGPALSGEVPEKGKP